jgi:hypothetical protein
MTKTNIKKEEKYIEERKKVLEKMNEILGVNLEEGKNIFILYDIQENEETKRKIEEISKDIKYYYNCTNYGYFKDKSRFGNKNREITLIRAFYKQNGYKLEKKTKMITIEKNKTKVTMEYKIVKK